MILVFVFFTSLSSFSQIVLMKLQDSEPRVDWLQWSDQGGRLLRCDWLSGGGEIDFLSALQTG